MGDREVKQNMIIEFAVLIAGLILKQMQCNFKYYSQVRELFQEVLF